MKKRDWVLAATLVPPLLLMLLFQLL